MLASYDLSPTAEAYTKNFDPEETARVSLGSVSALRDVQRKELSYEFLFLRMIGTPSLIN
ncbi:hypothetical protein BYT27DRAFT_7182021 [Phlegmacium glaucopus]|nr:hypothetical protein BYT27DRAFT_7182021 [Phlegmacium glaucopus]